MKKSIIVSIAYLGSLFDKVSHPMGKLFPSASKSAINSGRKIKLPTLKQPRTTNFRRGFSKKEIPDQCKQAGNMQTTWLKRK